MTNKLFEILYIEGKQKRDPAPSFYIRSREGLEEVLPLLLNQLEEHYEHLTSNYSGQDIYKLMNQVDYGHKGNVSYRQEFRGQVAENKELLHFLVGYNINRNLFLGKRMEDFEEDLITKIGMEYLENDFWFDFYRQMLEKSVIRADKEAMIECKEKFYRVIDGEHKATRTFIPVYYDFQDAIDELKDKHTPFYTFLEEFGVLDSIKAISGNKIEVAVCCQKLSDHIYS